MTLGVYRRQVVLSDYQTDLLKFRDYLRSNPDARSRYEYQHLKEYLSIQYPDNRAKYTQEKEAFINSILNK